MKATKAKKTMPMVFSRLGAETRTAPFAMTARRLFGLDVLLGIALVSLMLAPVYGCPALPRIKFSPVTRSI
jgi:hypothetical protein